MIVFYIIVAVLVLLFGIFSYLNAATWNVLHVLAMFLTFAAACTGLVFLSAVVKTKTTWQSKAETFQGTIDELNHRIALLETGSSVSPTTGKLSTQTSPTGSIKSAEAELKRVLYNRGRVFRDVQKTQVVNNRISLVLPQAPGDRSLKPDDVLYAFSQMPSPTIQGVTVPAYYISEVVVRTVAGQNISVEPTTPLESDEVNLLNQSNTWVLYDKMPVDEHQLFEEMTPEEVSQLMLAAAARVGMAQPLADELLAEIQRSGQQAQPGDPEESLQSLVTFQEQHEIQVDADGVGAAAGMEFEPTSGLAMASYLQQGAPTVFSKGDQVLLPTAREPGKSLVDQGIVTIDEQVYVRPLKDFSYEFHNYKAVVHEMQDKAYTLQEDIDMLREAETKAKEIVTYREREKANLQADRTKVLYEQEQISDYKQKLQDHLRETLRTNSRLYRTNQTLADELEEIHEAIKRKHDQEELRSVSQDALTIAN